MNETLKVSGLDFEIRRSPRRNTVEVTVDRAGDLVIHSPREMSSVDLERYARKKLLWVHRKLAIKGALAPQTRPSEYITGETFYYLGRGYRLTLVDRQDEPLVFDSYRFLLRRDACSTAGEHFRNWYIAAGSEWIARRVRPLARRVIARPSRITVRDLGFNWGTCGKSGALLFNWRLIQLPISLIDYVICHELAHLREPHHGPAFWAHLEAVQPDWRQRKEQLDLSSRTFLRFNA
jgi:predicted metal-dependent hydrolase